MSGGGESEEKVEGLGLGEEEGVGEAPERVFPAEVAAIADLLWLRTSLEMVFPVASNSMSF